MGTKMMQNNLSGLVVKEILEISRSERREEGPWAHVCSYACWHALEEKCVCRCSGRYHGEVLRQPEAGQEKLDLKRGGRWHDK